MRILNPLALLLVIVGGLNWALVGLFELDLVAEVFGEEFGTTNAASRVVYVLVGAAAAYLAVTLLPALARGDEAPAGRPGDARA